jgi:hypothetical protein
MDFQVIIGLKLEKVEPSWSANCYAITILINSINNKNKNTCQYKP